MIAQISKFSEDAIHQYVKRCFVKLTVTVAEDWRNDSKFLQQHNLDGSGQ